jgi:branched-chain amino acid transport system ATP-binding protein
MPEPSRSLLELDGVKVNYGAAPALWGVSMTVRLGELVCVVGPNGAGKSTLINTIAGLLRAREGTLRFNGCRATASAPPASRSCPKGGACSRR